MSPGKQTQPGGTDRTGHAWAWWGLAVFLALAWTPLLILVPDAAIEVLRHGAGSLVLPGPRTSWLLLQSLAYAAAVAGAAAIMGLAAAAGLCRRGAPPAWTLMALPALALIPPTIQALGWMQCGLLAQELARASGMRLATPTGWGMAWWSQTMGLLPVTTGCALIGLLALDGRLLEAAKVQSDDAQVFWRVVFPLALPMVLAGAALAFLQAFLDHGLPVLFGCNVYAMEVFAEFAATRSAGRAMLLALPMAPFAVLAVLLGLRSLHGAGRIAGLRGRRIAPLPLSPRLRRLAAGPGMALLAVQALIPALVLVASPGAWTRLPETFVVAAPDMVFTFATALAAAAVALPLGLATAWLLDANSGRRPPNALWLAVFLPLAAPAPLIGVGLATLSGHAPWSFLADAGLMPLLAGLARFLPLAVVVIQARLRELGPSLFEAARMFGPPGPRFALRILFPLSAGGCLAASGLVLALCVNELGASVVVCPPGLEPLAIRIFNYLHYGALDTAAGLCLMTAALTVGAGLAGALAWRRLGFDAGMAGPGDEEEP